MSSGASPTGIFFVTRVVASTRTTLSRVGSVIHTAPPAKVAPSGALPTWVVAVTRWERGSSRASRPSSVLTTQTAPSPVASPWGPLGTRIVPAGVPPFVEIRNTRPAKSTAVAPTPNARPRSKASVPEGDDAPAAGDEDKAVPRRGCAEVGDIADRHAGELLPVGRAVRVQLAVAEVDRPHGVAGDDRRSVDPRHLPRHGEARALDAEGDELVATRHEEQRR